MKLTKQDIAFLEKKGFSVADIESQVSKLKQGSSKINVSRACTLNDGITVVPENEKGALLTEYDSLVKGKSMTRFIPASGAATRMFKDLAMGEPWSENANRFFDNIAKFPFFKELNEKLHTNEKSEICNVILTSAGLNYNFLPKALIPFHETGSEIRKAILDQLIEGVKYSAKNQKVNFHFTVSPMHLELVENEVAEYVADHELLKHVELTVDYSIQKENTNTVALNSNDDLARTENGDVLFRPGGHGTLIYNLNALQHEIIVVKNIDNIAHEDYQDTVVSYKKVLIAHGLKVQKSVFEILNSLDKEVLSLENREWVKNTFGIKKEMSSNELYKFLNRPLRVAGMVKNEGQPGGGPFWVNDRLEIIEGAQLDQNDSEIKSIIQEASHFNPVDIVCFPYNYKKQKFNLLNYVDYEAYFTSKKVVDNQEIKILEYPGLWNGAMSNWLTLFIDVPVKTFNPVKTVVDLLNPMHQAKTN